MLYEKPMWVWKNAQYKSILVDLNNGIMISGNGHDTSPLSNIFIAGLLPVTEYSYTVVLLLLLKYKIWVLLPPPFQKHRILLKICAQHSYMNTEFTATFLLILKSAVLKRIFVFFIRVSFLLPPSVWCAVVSPGWVCAGGLADTRCAHYLKHVWLRWARLGEEWIRLLDCEHLATYL